MSFGKMNSFIDIVVMCKIKDPKGFATTAYVRINFMTHAKTCEEKLAMMIEEVKREIATEKERLK